jgi:hypothetical protein
MLPVNQKVRIVFGLVLTLLVLHFIPNRPLVLIVLLCGWLGLFWPIHSSECVAFLVAAGFFTVQNYVCLRAGLFEFRFKDILLMPYYEPALWGFYFVSMKRFVSGAESRLPPLEWKGVVGTIVTSVMFSVFSGDQQALLVATLCSTAFLFVLFHTRGDVYYAAYALILGFIVELFGVSTGLWSYPRPDFLGIPFWFATMWISVGVLGRRFLFPVSEWLARQAGGYRA